MRDEPRAASRERADLAVELELLALTDLPEPLARAVARRVSASVRLPCRLTEAKDATTRAPTVPVSWLRHREQVDADALLATLEALPAAPGTLRVALTALDLGNPVFSYFFGRARMGGPAALVSLARLRPEFYGLPADDELLLRRTTREVLHELGHLGGLAHCHDTACVMRFAATVEDIDLRGGTWCASCARALPRSLADHDGLHG